MCFVIHGNACRKFDGWCGTLAALTLRLFDDRKEIESFVLQRAAQSLFDQLKITRVGDSMCFRVAHPKNAENSVVGAGERISIQDIDRNDCKGSGNFGQHLLALPW